MMDFITTSAQNLAPATTFVARKRVALFGDSELALGYRDVNVGTSAGTFVVSDDPTLGRIATIDTASGSGGSGQSFYGVGNYVSLQTNGDPTYTLALNGAFTPILKFNSTTQFVVSATYGGQTMPLGDYSNPLSSGLSWVCYSPSTRYDSNLLQWIRFFNNDPFDVVGLYAITGAKGTSLPYQVARSAYGPAYDIAVISVGTNDMNTSPASAAMAKCYQVFYVLQNTVSQLQSSGKQVIIQLPIPLAILNTQTLPMAEAEAVFRKLVSNWAGRNNVIVIDTFAQMLDGTSTSGLGYAAWTATNVHINTVGSYNIAKLPSISQVVTQNPYVIDYQPVSVIEDNLTYLQTATAWAGSTSYSVGNTVSNNANLYYCSIAGNSSSTTGPSGTGNAITDGTVTWAYIGPNMVNMVGHPCMDGTGGTNGASAVFVGGTVPTGWYLSTSGTFGAGSTSTANNTRTSITNTNSSRWGKEWNISAVFGASGAKVNCIQPLYGQNYGWQYGNQSTVTITIASPAVITWTAHGLVNGQEVQFSSTNTLPTGISSGVSYFVVNATTNTFQVSATYGGTAINTSGTQVGTHTCYAAKMITGNWYQFGMTLTVLNSWTTPTATIAGIDFRIETGGGTAVNSFYPRANGLGGNATTYPMTTNDVVTLKSEPFYYSASGWSWHQLVMTIQSAAAGTANFALSSAWLRQVPNPNI